MPKSKHQVPGRVRSAYEFIKAHRDQYSVQTMCRVLEVAPCSGPIQGGDEQLRLIGTAFSFAESALLNDFVQVIDCSCPWAEGSGAAPYPLETLASVKNILTVFA
jgi:hypothetical protein